MILPKQSSSLFQITNQLWIPEYTRIFVKILTQFNHADPARYLYNLSTQHGPLIHLRLGHLPTLIISSSKLAKSVYKTQDLEFSSRPFLIGQQKLSYNGLDLAFSPYNANWRELRKVCTIHLFNSIRVQKFRPIREQEVGRMLEKVSHLVGENKVVNVGEVMLCLTSCFICRIGFGRRYVDGGSEIKRFRYLLGEAQFVLWSFFFGDLFRFMGWLDWVLGFSPRVENSFKGLDGFYQELIDEHLDKGRDGENEDIIDVLLQLTKERGFKIDITLDHIKAVLMNVFVGGTDASDATVVWAMTYLMKNPNIMKKVQEEIRSFTKNQAFVKEDDIQNLPYLKAIVKETMRLQPAAPLAPRSTTQDCTLEGYKIPANTLVFINAYAVGRDPEAWNNPLEFNPYWK